MYFGQPLLGAIFFKHITGPPLKGTRRTENPAVFLVNGSMTSITQNERKNTDSKEKRSIDQRLLGLFPIGKAKKVPYLEWNGNALQESFSPSGRQLTRQARFLQISQF